MEKNIGRSRRPLPYLPENIVEEILLRLPARSIVRFRAATKLFNHLSTLPSFVSAHTECSHAAPPSLLVLTPERVDRFEQLNPDERWIEYGNLQATCDGLLLFSYARTPEFTVVNPATGQWTMASVDEPQGCKCSILGFYRHRSSGQHRMLIQLYAYRFRRYVVLTIGSNEVRPVKSFVSYNDISFRNHRVTASDGKLYVLALGRNYRECDRPCVVIFDTEKESLDSIALPDEIRCLLGEPREPECKLMEMDGKVCLYRVHSVPEAQYLRVEMWVLVSGVWVKKRTRTEVVQGWGEGLFIVDDPCVVNHFPNENNRKLLLAKWDGNEVCSTENEFSFYCLDEAVVSKEVMAMRNRFWLCNPVFCAFNSNYDDYMEDSSSYCIAWYRESLTTISV